MTNDKKKVSSFDQTIIKSHEWYNVLAKKLDMNDMQEVHLIFKAVIHTLRDRLPVEEVTDLGSQLPALLRGYYYEGWRPGAERSRIGNMNEFYENVIRVYGRSDEINAAEATEAVLSLLHEKISAGEIEDIRRVLPKEMKDI